MSETYTHISWRSMKQRCFSKNDKDYVKYGGRGITVSSSWLTYKNFLADMGERPFLSTLERRNVNGNYELSNCFWATAKEQANNRRNNTIVFYEGKEQKLTSLCKEHSISIRTVRSRIRAKWLSEDWFRPALGINDPRLYESTKQTEQRTTR